MLFRLPVLLLVSFLILFLPYDSARSVGATEGAGKRPLDLPAGGPGFADDEEDLPEAFQFFGEIIEGDGFFFCFAAYYSP